MSRRSTVIARSEATRQPRPRWAIGPRLLASLAMAATTSLARCFTRLPCGVAAAVWGCHVGLNVLQTPHDQDPEPSRRQPDLCPLHPRSGGGRGVRDYP